LKAGLWTPDFAGVTEMGFPSHSGKEITTVIQTIASKIETTTVLEARSCLMF